MKQGTHRAHWLTHVNGLAAPTMLRPWLTDRMSLTQKLTTRAQQFRVRRLRQQRGLCLADEMAAVALPRRMGVQEREVLLLCDGEPMVFAHSIVPLSATASDWPFFGGLGERSLGTTLFGDPRVRRGALCYARLSPAHPLFQRACAAADLQGVRRLFARRCLYRRKNGLLLVTEIFLPMIARLPRHAPVNPMNKM
ncbi:MAG: chorismate lyase [Proteobacteria bacterium]|nr:chorismate lyase [Pseudomonadota bacterium]